RFKDYGIQIYHPNYEVWDKRLFSLVSPGKERYVGREEWHRRILDAAEVFGPSHVIPNFVAGVEMARPFGFETIDEAIASTVEGARALWEEASDEELKKLAGEVRARYHEPNRATYMVMRIVNYTNVCVAQCDYCAFYVLPNQDGGYVLSREDVFAKIDELVEFGGDLVAFNGGFNPRLPLDYYSDLFASVRERYGDRVEFYALTIAEFVFLADRAGLSYAEAAARLRDAGVYWITG